MQPMDGIERVFAYYIPSLTGSTPPQPRKQKEVIPQPITTKPYGEMITGEMITLPNIAKYADALPTVRQMVDMPEAWNVTIIENKSTEIVVACAPPTFGLIAPEKYDALTKHDAQALSAIPKKPVIPKSIKLIVTYSHLDARRKTVANTQIFRADNEDTKQDLLERWANLTRDEGKEPCPKIARKMSLRATDYEWFTGSNSPLVTPWYDSESITFQDPPRSSTEIVAADDDAETEGPSFGPDTDGQSGPSAGTAGSAPPGTSNASGTSSTSPPGTSSTS
jgi:hypothetical protein